MRVLIVTVLLAIGFSGSLLAQELQDDIAPISYDQADPACATCPPAVPAATGDCECCRCFPCECPQEPAPCIPCPHVSTISPYWNVSVFGALQGNMLFNTARPVAPGIPLFLFPGTAQPENTVDVFARSSSIGALVTGPEVSGYKTSGLITAVFYNDALIVDRYGILPIQAWGDLRNEEWRLAAGVQFNVFNPNLPTMLTFASMFGSGNAGNNFPGQFRVERYLHPSADEDLTIQLALTEPNATGVASQSPISSIITGTPVLRITEDNGWPMVEGRMAYAHGEVKQEGLEAKRAFEIGVSGAVTQLRTVVPPDPNVVANVFGIGADIRWRVNDRFGVIGELFTGEGLGFLNGGILQSTNSTTYRGIRSRGGWGEFYYYITPCLHTHCGAGIDDPFDNDLAGTQVTRNQTYFGNLLWDMSKQVRVGFEFTWRETAYVALPDNEGAGFHTQVQWSF